LKCIEIHLADKRTPPVHDINLPLLSWGNRAPSEHTAVCQRSPADKVRIQIQTCSSGNTVRGAIPSIPCGSNMCVDCHLQDRIGGHTLGPYRTTAQSHTSEARLSDTKISCQEGSVPSTLGFVRVILANPSFNLLPDLERQLAGQIGLALCYKARSRRRRRCCACGVKHRAWGMSLFSGSIENSRASIVLKCSLCPRTTRYPWARNAAVAAARIPMLSFARSVPSHGWLRRPSGLKMNSCARP
jgi:hypothetical protein